MSALARLYNFVNGAASNADAVDAEFDQIITALNTAVVLKDGTVSMTGALVLPSNPTANLQAATKQYVDALIGAPAVSGFLAMWGGAAAPAGWLLCDGAAVSRATYAALFAAIGTNHGAGDGSTTFNVPDLKGRAPIGAGSGAGLTSRVVGTKLGGELLTSHSHQQLDTLIQAGGTVNTWTTIVAGPGMCGLYASGVNTVAAGGGASENMQPSTVVLYVIKV